MALKRGGHSAGGIEGPVEIRDQPTTSQYARSSWKRWNDGLARPQERTLERPGWAKQRPSRGPLDAWSRLFPTYGEMRNEVMAYHEPRTAAMLRESQVQRHDAMDMDTPVKSSGKGGADRFAGTCFNCGKVGHRLRTGVAGHTVATLIKICDCHVCRMDVICSKKKVTSRCSTRVVCVHVVCHSVLLLHTFRNQVVRCACLANENGSTFSRTKCSRSFGGYFYKRFAACIRCHSPTLMPQTTCLAKRLLRKSLPLETHAHNRKEKFEQQRRREHKIFRRDAPSNKFERGETCIKETHIHKFLIRKKQKHQKHVVVAVFTIAFNCTVVSVRAVGPALDCWNKVTCQTIDRKDERCAKQSCTSTLLYLGFAMCGVNRHIGAINQKRKEGKPKRPFSGAT